MDHRIRHRALLQLLTLALILLAQPIDAASQKRNQSGVLMNGKSLSDGDAQWAADPEKGWVRAGERQKASSATKEKSKGNSGKQRNSDSKNRF
jgi:hypothetical protein